MLKWVLLLILVSLDPRGGNASCVGAFHPYFEGLKQTGYVPLRGVGNAEAWVLDGPLSAKGDYEAAFASVLKLLGREPQNYFDDFVRERRLAGSPRNVLDLFGSGFFVDVPDAVTTVTGFRFGPYARWKLPRGYSGARLPTEVLGDVFFPENWAKLDRSMVERGIPAMDLVTLRPMGGWVKAGMASSPERNALGLAYLVHQVLARLDPHGEFYFSIPVSDYSGDFSEHPILRRLKSEVRDQTGHALVLLPGRSPEGGTYHLSGALVPKAAN